MHGQTLALVPHSDLSARLVKAPMALGSRYDQSQESALGFSFRDARLIIPRGIVLALTMMLLALAGGAASVWLAKPVYSAGATIKIDLQAWRILGTENIAHEAGRAASDRVIQAQVDLLASSSTAQHVASKLNLARNPLFLREVGLENEAPGETRSSKVIALLQDRLSVSSPRGTNIVDVRFNSHDPTAAERIANAFAETFVSDSVKRRLVAHDFSRRFLHGQREITKVRLEQSARNLVNYTRSASLVAADLEAAGLGSNDREYQSLSAAPLVHLNAAYSRAQENWMQAQQRWQRAVSSPKPVNPISIINHAGTPALPAYPRPALNMAFAALLGALAVGAQIARSQINKKVDGPGDVARDLDAQLLGIVPCPKIEDVHAPALSDPPSSRTEAHHAIFVALDQLARMSDCKVILLTSSDPDEGKSMITITLSATFAAAGRKVLVVDTDVRGGSLHRMLRLSNQLGLSDVLAKDSTYELMDVAQFCADRGFSVVPRGQSATNLAELLASRRFADLLDEAANSYDVVIMDGPPVLGFADAPRLSGMADATVFVLQANQTSHEHAQLAMRRLSEAGAEHIELVITESNSAQDGNTSDYASSYNPAVGEEVDFIPEEAPLAEPASEHRQPVHQQGEQAGPELPSPWASWLLAQQQEGTRHAG